MAQNGKYIRSLNKFALSIKDNVNEINILKEIIPKHCITSFDNPGFIGDQTLRLCYFYTNNREIIWSTSKIPPLHFGTFCPYNPLILFLD